MLAEIYVDRERLESLSKEELIDRYVLLYKQTYELQNRTEKLEKDLFQKQEPWI